MTAEIIDGRKIAHSLKAEVGGEIADLRAHGLHCGLATVLVGEDYSSRAYERRIARIAGELGVPCEQVSLPAAAAQDEVLTVVKRLNADPAVSGILVLRPLPPQVCEVEVFQTLAPEKDIESVHPENAGLLSLGTPRFVPSTAASIFYLLDSWLDGVGEDRASFYHRSLIVVVGRSNNVGKPAISLAYERQASVMSVDEWASKEGRLGWHTRQADVLVVAAGVASLIRAEHVRSGAVVIDVGINPLDDPVTGTVRMVGDVAFDEARTRARAIAPVPGGVGPVTDLWLVRNSVIAARAAATRWIRPRTSRKGPT
jgi:methylenetetrahydrofolate dehydrogenase (NADP+) / methenyltetrahydrofolate cyclohydrolase